jgi:hypothetical protein
MNEIDGQQYHTKYSWLFFFFLGHCQLFDGLG